MNTTTRPASQNFGHETLDSETAAFVVMGLEDKITITLEGVDIVRGWHSGFGHVTIITPVAGESSLLYPFENHVDF